MDLNFVGSRVNHNKKTILSEAAEFFANGLMSKRVRCGLIIDIEINKHTDFEGACVNEDNHKDPRFFTLVLKQRPDINKMVRTLAHEMVHVRQNAMNQLQHITLFNDGATLPATVSKWKGKLWVPKMGELICYDSPWEVEAYGRENGLTNQFATHWNAMIGYDPELGG